MLLNLGSNALKFTDYGEVSIRMSLLEETPAACHVRFSCRDTGIGISPELHQKIFEPFFQASAGTVRKYGGTGLGMSIVQGILTAMNSRLTVQSGAGQGSLFEFDLWLERRRCRKRSGTKIPGPCATGAFFLPMTMRPTWC